MLRSTPCFSGGRSSLNSSKVMISFDLTYHDERKRGKLIQTAEQVCLEASKNQLLIKTGQLQMEPPF